MLFTLEAVAYFLTRTKQCFRLPKICADSESLNVCQGDNVLGYFVGPNTTISGPSSSLQRNVVSLAFQWWPNVECWLGSFVTFQGIRTKIAKKLYILWFFKGGGGVSYKYQPQVSPNFNPLLHRLFFRSWHHFLFLDNMEKSRKN